MVSLKFLLLIITITSFETSANGLRILGIFPVAARSHYIIGETILKELARRGHHIDAVSHFPQKKNLENFTDISLAGTALMTANNLTFEQATTYSGLKLHTFAKPLGHDLCELLGHPEFQKLMNTPRGTYDVILVELFFSPCYIAFGQQLDAPVIGVVACKLHDWLYRPFGNSLLPSYIPSAFARFSQEMSFWERLENTLMVHAVIAESEYFAGGQMKQIEKYFQRRVSLYELYDDVALMLINEHFSMNDIKPVTPDIIDVGGLHVDDDDQKLTPDLQKWLDESTKGCVYFSFGSQVKIESMPKEILKKFYETFERIAPVRVLLKIVDADALPDGLPKNVKISSWLPQIAIFKHKNTRAFITHGGLLSTQEAVAFKVPMIGLPIFGDQPNNIQNYVHRKIAISLSIETLTADSMTDAVNSILNNPTYRENINRISDLFLDRPMSALETAIYWTQYIAKHKNALKSPATKLNWWQLNSVDVYGFILVIFIMIIIVIRSLLLLLWKFGQNNFSRHILQRKKNE